MSEERIAAIRAREQAATRGPWCVEDDGESWDDGAQSADWPWRIEHVCNFAEECRPGKAGAAQSYADAAFIAESRDDVPFLLEQLENQAEVIRHLQAEVERPLTEIARLRAIIDGYRSAVDALGNVEQEARAALAGPGAPPQAEEP